MIPDFTNIDKYKLHLDLIQQVAAQVIKDFSMFGLEIELNNNQESPYQQLAEQMYPHFEHFYKNNLHRFSAILYRIDIDESKLNEKLKQIPAKERIHFIVDEVLKRELQKVVLRKFFSKK
jgi:hypothetical protein